MNDEDVVRLIRQKAKLHGLRAEELDYLLWLVAEVKASSHKNESGPAEARPPRPERAS